MLATLVASNDKVEIIFFFSKKRKTHLTEEKMQIHISGNGDGSSSRLNPLLSPQNMCTYSKIFYICICARHVYMITHAYKIF